MKYALSPTEIALLIEGLDAGAREARRNAEDAQRLGYPSQAREFASKAVAFASLASTAKSVTITRLTARY